jgi:hypothetical protein
LLCFVVEISQIWSECQYNGSNHISTYKFYYIDIWRKGKDEEYFRLLKSIKLMIKKYLLVINEL